MAGFEAHVGEAKFRENTEGESLVLWLTSDLLSVPAFAEALFSIRRKLNQYKALTVRTTRLDPSPTQDISANFESSFETYGFPLLVYLAQLEHVFDLDWQSPTRKLAKPQLASAELRK
jgi:hypothetical protein